jgi:23S rRNA (guanosine2251-2'-O)-methyltransferase
MGSQDLVFGIHAVEELLARGGGEIRQVVVDAGAGAGARRLADEAARRGIEVRVLPGAAFAAMAAGRPFQGIAARVEPFAYADDDAVIGLASRDPAAVVVALDSVQDPQNVGSILRSCAFFGASGVLIPKDRTATVTPGVVRASAGAAGRVPVALVTNLARSIRACRDAGFTAIGAAASGGVAPAGLPRRGPFLLVMGSEAEGLRRLVRESCDLLVTIPSPGGFESLNVGVATGILLHWLTVARPEGTSGAPADSGRLTEGTPPERGPSTVNRQPSTVDPGRDP